MIHNDDLIECDNPDHIEFIPFDSILETEKNRIHQFSAIWKQWATKHQSLQKECVKLRKDFAAVSHKLSRKGINEDKKNQANNGALSKAKSIQEIIDDGHTSLRAIAQEMNRREIPTAKEGTKWHKDTVRNVMKRAETQGVIFKFDLSKQQIVEP